MGRIKSKEVAEALGVSTATVSLAINGKAGVNEETRQKIMEYISKTQGQAGTDIQKVKNIIFVNTERMFSPEMQSIFKMSQMETVARLQKEGIEVSMAYAYGSGELREILQNSMSDGTKGLAIHADEFTEAEYEIMEFCKIPFVLLDCEMRRPGWNVVSFHNSLAIAEGMRYLKKRGCREVLYFKNKDVVYNFQMRRKAFQEYLDEDKDMHGGFLEVGDDLKSIGIRVAELLGQRKKLPDAIFLEDYLVSIGTAGALEKLGIRVPDEVALIGIDELPATVILPYRLTHFRVPHREKGRMAAEMLIDQIRNLEKGYGECRQLSMKLIRGESTF